MSTSAPSPVDRPYPEGWEADVVLRDGRPAHLRPIAPSDAEALRRFHARLSPETVYFRFFAPRPQLSDEDVARFTGVDYVDRVALIATVHGEIIGVGRFDRIHDDRAEVAFVIEDAHQGRGLGSLLLEHLAAIGGECGIGTFEAEVLPQNVRMLSTFTDAGFVVARSYDDGVVTVSFDVAMNAGRRHVQESREHRAEARSLQQVLSPSSIAVVGASRQPGSVGHELLRHVVASNFQGLVYGVHPEAGQILGVRCYPSLVDIGEPVDLVVVAVRAELVPDVIAQAGQVGARGLVVVTEGDPGRSDLQRQVVAAAREGGMRVIGPAALGIINTNEQVRMNASLAPTFPHRDSIGFFCQSGALGIDILARLQRRGLGVSTFVSAGNRADVSGNDLLQYWEEDDDTSMVMLYLESIGNPRKFLRIARRVALLKPVVALRAVGAMQMHPLGHDVPVSDVSARAKEQLFARSGVIDTRSLNEMLDVAEVIRLRGVPAGSRLGIVGNSDAVAVLARNLGESAGLDVSAPSRIVGRASSADTYRRLLDEAGRDPGIDMIVAVYVPPVESDQDTEVREVIATCAAAIDKPTVAVVLGWTAQALRAAASNHRGQRALPVFTDVEHAVRALAHLAQYSRWKATALEGQGEDELSVDIERAREVLRGAVQDGEALSSANAQELLAAYGIASAELLPNRLSFAVRGAIDPLVGPLVSLGLAGPVAQVLEDVSYAVPPVSPADARRMVDALGVAPLMDGAGGTVPVDRAALADVLVRVGALVTDWPQVSRIDCAPVQATGEGAVVTGVEIVLDDDPDAPLREVRRLRA